VSSVRSAFNTDDRIRNGARSARLRAGARLGLLSAALLVNDKHMRLVAYMRVENDEGKPPIP
jgi:hypothetical protein